MERLLLARSGRSLNGPRNSLFSLKNFSLSYRVPLSLPTNSIVIDTGPALRDANGPVAAWIMRLIWRPSFAAGPQSQATSNEAKLDVERCRVLPRRELRTEGFPLCLLELEVGRREILAQRMLDGVVAVVGTQGVQQVEWQTGGVLHEMPFAVHIDVMMRAGVGFCVQAIQTSRDDNGLEKVRIHGAIGEAKLETARSRHADHVGSVVTGPCHRVRRPSCTRERAWCIDALVRIHRGICNRRDCSCMFEAASEKMPPLG